MTIATDTLGVVINELGCGREETMSITISNQDMMGATNFYGIGPYLAPIEHRILDLQKIGKTIKDIADSLDLSPTEVYRRLDIISHKIKSQRLRANSQGA